MINASTIECQVKLALLLGITANSHFSYVTLSALVSVLSMYELVITFDLRVIKVGRFGTLGLTALVNCSVIELTVTSRAMISTLQAT
jgi:hypothetical protein